MTKVNINMMDCARRQFVEELENEEDRVVELVEITMASLLASGEIDLKDFLARADVIAAAGKTVLISDYFEYFRLAAYLNRYTTEPIAVTLGLGSLMELFEERYYTKLEGGILEAFGRLFKKDLRIYVYPLRDPAHEELRTVDNVEIPGRLKNLFAHLVERGMIKQLRDFDEGVLHIFSQDVLKRIEAGDVSWESMVPPEIAEVIKRRRFFGYREAREVDDAVVG